MARKADVKFEDLFWFKPRSVSFIFELSKPPAGIQWAFEQRLVKFEQMNDVELEVGFVIKFNIGLSARNCVSRVLKLGHAKLYRIPLLVPPEL